MLTSKFAVTHIRGDEQEVLKTFPCEEKDKAIEYAQSSMREFNSGVIACVSAQFDDFDKMRPATCRVFEVYPINN